MRQLEDQLGAADVVLGADVLDRIDELAPPGSDVNPHDAYFTAPAIVHAKLRRQRVSIAAPHTVVTGLAFGEGPRWHDGELWFSDIHGHTVRRTTVDGRRHDRRRDPPRRAVRARLAPRRPLARRGDGDAASCCGSRADGSIVEHADLSPLARGSINDMIVAADGTAYVGDMGTRHLRGGQRACARADDPRDARRRGVVRGRRPRLAERPHPHRRRPHADRRRERWRAPHRVRRHTTTARSGTDAPTRS